MSTTSGLSDRIAIMRKNAFPKINLSPQIIISCNTKAGSSGQNLGCKGGDQPSLME